MLQALEQIIADLSGESEPALPSSLGLLAPLCDRLLRGPEPRESLLRLRALLLALGEEEADWPGESLPTHSGPSRRAEAPRSQGASQVPVLVDTGLAAQHGERGWIGDAGDAERMCRKALKGRELRALAAVLSAGPDLGRILARRPSRLRLLVDPTLGRPWSLAELKAALEQESRGVTDLDQLALSITSFRNDQVLRLAACEFLEAPLEQVGLELSHVADLCLGRAMAGVEAELTPRHGPPPCGVAAIAMGKHGAQELNFCSDIDVIYIYETDEGSSGGLSPHEYFSRLCQRASRLVSEPNPEGLCFRVDLRLRPEGSQGPVCNSLSGAERYYETWGGPWDRLAWLKARPAAGDLELGRTMVELLRPFVFPKAIRPEIMDQLQELNQRIQAQSRTAAGAWNVKLHAGGIREVEFFVQSLQLLHAGKQPGLQVSATLTALDRLLFSGLISESEQRVLAEAYQLWRRIEHRLQLYAGRQTHTLPNSGHRRDWLAGHLNTHPDGLTREVERRREQVNAIYSTLAGGAEEIPELVALLDPELPEEDAERLLSHAGFAQPSQAAGQIRMLGEKPWGPLGRAPSPAEVRLAPGLLEELSRSPDPDAALHHLVQLSLRIGPYRGLWQMLEENRSTLRLLISLFGSSDFLARLFIAHPELMDRLLMTGRARPRVTARELEVELDRRLATLEADDEEGQLNTLRKVRNEQVLRIGLHDIAGELSLEEVWQQLSDLAVALLARVYPLVFAGAARRYGVPRREDGSPAAMVIVALGKLGGGELTYASDLDLIFVHSGGEAGLSDGPRRVGSDEFFARVAQRLISALTATMEDGQLYQVDTRLRPSGNQGTLVTSLEALKDYHRGSAQPWERQILLKARPVAGDGRLGQELAAWVEDYVFDGAPDPLALGEEIDRLRGRLEQEGGGGRPGFHNLKLGRGGLLDVEFLVQYLQLIHGGEHPEVRGRATLVALAALGSAGLIQRARAEQLDHGYRFLRRLESRLRVVRDRGAEHLPTDAAALEVMARRLAYRESGGQSAGKQLLGDHRHHTSTIRSIYDDILGAKKRSET